EVDASSAGAASTLASGSGAPPSPGAQASSPSAKSAPHVIPKPQRSSPTRSSRIVPPAQPPVYATSTHRRTLERHHPVEPRGYRGSNDLDGSYTSCIRERALGSRKRPLGCCARSRDEVAMIHSRIAPSLVFVALTGCGPEMMLADPDAGSPPVSSDAAPPPVVRDASLASDADAPMTDAGPDASMPELDAAAPIPEACPEVVEGLNVIHLGETERRFWVSSPGSSTTPRAA